MGDLRKEGLALCGGLAFGRRALLGLRWGLPLDVPRVGGFMYSGVHVWGVAYLEATPWLPLRGEGPTWRPGGKALRGGLGWPYGGALAGLTTWRPC